MTPPGEPDGAGDRGRGIEREQVFEPADRGRRGDRAHVPD